MIILNENFQLIKDLSKYNLNFGVIKFDDYKGASEKIIKTESNSFDDNYIFHSNTYQGYNTTLEIIVRNSIKSEVIKNFRIGKYLSLPKEKNKVRPYYISEGIKITYYDEDYSKLSIPLYFNAFIYDTSIQDFNVTKGLIKTVNNIGSVFSEPIITIKGTGDLIFKVNDKTHILRNSSDGYIVDCRNKKQNVTNLNGELKNVTSDYDGEFPVLNTGKNTLQLIQGTEMSVQVNWRWLD